MSDWLHELPIAWMAIIVFGGTFLITGAIYAMVVRLAMDGWGRSFKAVSPGLLPPLGIIFGLFVARRPLGTKGRGRPGVRTQERKGRSLF